METVTKQDVVRDDVVISRRRGPLARRFAIVVGFVAVLLGVATPAFAVAPVVPDATGVVTDAAGNLSTGLLGGFTAALPYVIAVLVAFTIFAMVKRMLGAKKTAS